MIIYYYVFQVEAHDENVSEENDEYTRIDRCVCFD